MAVPTAGKSHSEFFLSLTISSAASKILSRCSFLLEGFSACSNDTNCPAMVLVSSSASPTRPGLHDGRVMHIYFGICWYIHMLRGHCNKYIVYTLNVYINIVYILCIYIKHCIYIVCINIVYILCIYIQYCIHIVCVYIYIYIPSCIYIVYTYIYTQCCTYIECIHTQYCIYIVCICIKYYVCIYIYTQYCIYIVYVYICIFHMHCGMYTQYCIYIIIYCVYIYSICLYIHTQCVYTHTIYIYTQYCVCILFIYT